MKTRPPNVSPETLRSLTDGWLLGHIHSIRPHQGGSSGSAKYAIESTEGRFLLKGRPHRALSPERLQLMRSVMAICLEAQLPVPELRPQADGARHIEQDGLVWELQTWMDGKSARRGRATRTPPESPWPCSTGQLEITLSSNHSSGESKVEFTSLVGRTMERFPSSKTSLQQLEALVGLAKKKSEERGVMDHPKQILHGDWHPKNLRMHSRRPGVGHFGFRCGSWMRWPTNWPTRCSKFHSDDRKTSRQPMAFRTSFSGRATAHIRVAIAHRKGTSRRHLEHVALADDRNHRRRNRASGCGMGRDPRHRCSGVDPSRSRDSRVDPRAKPIAGGGVDPDALTGTQRIDGSPKGGHRLRVESFVIQDHTPIRDFISVDAVGIALLKTRNHLGVRVQYTGCGVALKRVDTKPTMFSCGFRDQKRP